MKLQRRLCRGSCFGLRAPAATLLALLIVLPGWQPAAAGDTGSTPPLRFSLRDSATSLAEKFEVAQDGPVSLRVEGLCRGGAVVAKLDGQPITGALLSETEEGPASALVIQRELKAGRHVLHVREEPGLQVFRVENTQCYLATGTEYGGEPVLKLDFDQRGGWYPVEVRYGPGYEPMFWFSGKWDRYSDLSFTEKVIDVAGTSGANEARLRYTYVHAPRNLRMPTELILQRDAQTANVVLRVHQSLIATGPVDFSDKDNLEFLHVVIHRQYGRDWEDDLPDYFWNREQVDVDNDTLDGTHTHLVLMDDNSRRTFLYHPDSRDPKAIARSGTHHTGFGHPLHAENTIGGWFSKSGTGSVGWVMHKYRASFAEGLSPIHSHCGDGADTHIYAGWGRLFFPWKLTAGDRLDTEYTLQFMPSEPLREEIELINECDLILFGPERTTRSPIVGWYGTRDLCGLIRADGSALLLGIGENASAYPIPEAVRPSVKRVFRFSDIRNSNWAVAPAEGRNAVVEPGWITVVDCGSAREGPELK